MIYSIMTVMHTTATQKDTKSQERQPQRSFASNNTANEKLQRHGSFRKAWQKEKLQNKGVRRLAVQVQWPGERMKAYSNKSVGRVMKEAPIQWRKAERKTKFIPSGPPWCVEAPSAAAMYRETRVWRARVCNPTWTATSVRAQPHPTPAPPLNLVTMAPPGHGPGLYPPGRAVARVRSPPLQRPTLKYTQKPYCHTL
jgi:hypothetical protein